MYILQEGNGKTTNYLKVVYQFNSITMGPKKSTYYIYFPVSEFCDDPLNYSNFTISSTNAQEKNSVHPH